jgi:hypothetical protein
MSSTEKRTAAGRLKAQLRDRDRDTLEKKGEITHAERLERNAARTEFFNGLRKLGQVA